MKNQLARLGMSSLEVVRADTSPVHFAALVKRLEADSYLRRALAVAGTAILGIDGEGVPLLLRLCSPDVVPCLITGDAGCGKTELVRTLVASLALEQRPRDLQLALFDPNGDRLGLFAPLPHLLFPITREPSKMLEQMRFLVAEMERRRREQTGYPRIIIVVDELEDMLQACGPDLEPLLTRLVRWGRDAGISVVACALESGARILGGLHAEMPVRLAGRVASAEEARVAAGRRGSGAEGLPGLGQFVLVAGGETIRFQAAYVRPEEWPALVERVVSSSRLGGWRIIPFRMRERATNYEL